MHSICEQNRSTKRRDSVLKYMSSLVPKEMQKSLMYYVFRVFIGNWTLDEIKFGIENDEKQQYEMWRMMFPQQVREIEKRLHDIVDYLDRT